MMARELEEPEKGLNPEPEIALGEDGMSDEVNLGESDSSYREVDNLVKELQGADIPLTINEDFLLEEEGFEMLPEVVVEENAIGGAVAVFGAPLRENPLLRFGSEGTSVLGGEQLRMKLGGTLGETLASQPGVSASSYSPGVSRPVIRGFDGVRVRTLRDGLGTMDLSEDSPDHGVLIDLLMTEEVEIHRGPASLLYGNSAIGGAINTRTRYIPSVDLGERFAAMVASGYDTQGSGYHWGTAAEMRGEFWALGFSASQRNAGDISIPGKAWTESYDELENPRSFIPGVGIVELENPDGELANSFHERSSWSLGGRVGSEEGFSVGTSFQKVEQNYGIPYYFAGDATDL
ncbi:MAG: TonB-dependent receptor plug domain-containing protein, partial [Akkermansiaceae bacterium]|nr:TonB-dependent receptor plug domain-containing protein [Akkermansiaceae bacterium]